MKALKRRFSSSSGSPRNSSSKKHAPSSASLNVASLNEGFDAHDEPLPPITSPAAAPSPTSAEVSDDKAADAAVAGLGHIAALDVPEPLTPPVLASAPEQALAEAAALEAAAQRIAADAEARAAAKRAEALAARSEAASAAASPARAAEPAPAKRAEGGFSLDQMLQALFSFVTCSAARSRKNC